MTPIVARSHLRTAVLDLLAAGQWEPWAAVAELVAEDTGASPEAVEQAIWRMWRAGAVDIRGRSHRRQIRARGAAR